MIKIIFVLFNLLLFINCGGKNADNDTIQVVATTGMVGDIVREIGGELVTIEVLMGPGIDPHLYKAKESDVISLSQADLVFYNGLHLEAKMGEVLEKMNLFGIVSIAVSESIPDTNLILIEEGLYDPHVWMDPDLWKYSIWSVTDMLIKQDPEHISNYSAAYSNYLLEIVELDAYAREKLALIAPEQRVLITAHDAFTYFGEAYNFQVEGIQGISTASEASASVIRDLANRIVESGIPAIFVETSVSSKVIEALQEAVQSRGMELSIGGELYSDALGDEQSGADNYIKMFRANVDTIAQALAGGNNASDID